MKLDLLQGGYVQADETPIRCNDPDLRDSKPRPVGCGRCLDPEAMSSSSGGCRGDTRNYHRYVTASKAFERVDWAIWESLWFWAKRRHRKRFLRWLARRYWHAFGSRSWTFAACLDGENSAAQPDWLRLNYATDTKIRRHLKIKAKANPFDPEWSRYFEERALLKRLGKKTRKSGKSVVDTAPTYRGL